MLTPLLDHYIRAYSCMCLASTFFVSQQVINSYPVYLCKPVTVVVVVEQLSEPLISEVSLSSVIQPQHFLMCWFALEIWK